MKKIYTSALAFAMITTGVFAQSSNAPTELLPEKKSAITSTNIADVKVKKNYEKDLQVELWGDDFAYDTTWTIDHDADVCSLDWEIGVGLTNSGAYPTPAIQSTTADNGYAMLDSDYYGGVTGGDESSWITNATAIDLTDNAYIVLQFESNFRYFPPSACFVVISTNNTDWPTLNSDFDPSTNDNVFQVFEDISTNNSTLNPETSRLNISSIAGNETTVWVRFHWTGSWGYSWYVDDVKILELPDNDMKLDYGVISHNGTSDEYARVPVSQMNTSTYFAALSSNIGGAQQTDVVIDILVEDSDGGEILNVSSDAEATVDQDSTFVYETDEDLTLTADLYTTTFTVTSAEEVDGDEFANNVEMRNFEITENVYSLDGIGVHEVSLLSSMGTNSFTGGADGFMMMTYYDLNQTVNEVHGVEFLITTTTVPGGSVYVHLLDTADVFADIVDDPLESSDEVTITQEHVDAGFVRIYFDTPYSADADGYFASVEMYSNDNANDIRILDDVTVPQPSGSSLIYIPNDQVWGNGNASAIRILTSGPNAIDEIEKIAVLAQNVPNPAVDYTTITFELLNSQNVTVRLTDMIGKVVIEDNLGNLSPGNHNHTLELSGLKAGTYHYSIVTDSGVLSKSMQIIK